MKNLEEKVIEILQIHNNEKLTVNEIALKIFKTYPDMAELYNLQVADHKNKKTGLMQCSAEIGARYNSSKSFVSSVAREKNTKNNWVYFLSSQHTIQQPLVATKIILTVKDEAVEIDIKQEDEAALYPILNQYLRHIGVRSKRINEKKSRNSKGAGGNKWLHPDLVGLKIKDEKFSRDVKECLNNFSYNRVEMLSYEVKKTVSLGDVRESFFQAVSNSSWANVGYLVATEIKCERTFEELSILSALHGIGFILLDKKNPKESKILLPALHKENVDWRTINRILEENSDFKEYVVNIKEYFQTNRIREDDWIYKD
jgi:hypothetical protein